MGIYLSTRELAETEPAETAAFRSPVPTQMVSNGEFNPLPQTARQRQVEERIKHLADAAGRRLGMDRRRFLRTSCGMAAAFLALNEVFGPVFDVSAAEAAEPEAAASRADALSKQFAHAVIRPAETRVRIIRALRLLATKHEDRPRKKHSVMPV